MNDEHDIEIETEDLAKASFGGSPDDSFDESFGDADAEEKVKKLRAEIESLRQEKQEYLDGWQRSKADYVNVLKRLDEEKKTEKLRGVVKAAEALLPAFDALERAKEHGDIPEGFAGIIKQLEGGFAGLGLVALGKVGETFDPALHEALGQDPVEDAARDDTVTFVLEKGWKIGEMVIRPAKVRIGVAVG